MEAKKKFNTYRAYSRLYFLAALSGIDTENMPEIQHFLGLQELCYRGPDSPAASKEGKPNKQQERNAYSQTHHAAAQKSPRCDN